MNIGSKQTINIYATNSNIGETKMVENCKDRKCRMFYRGIVETCKNCEFDILNRIVFVNCGLRLEIKPNVVKIFSNLKEFQNSEYFSDEILKAIQDRLEYHKHIQNNRIAEYIERFLE